jgi:hypothetical protein
LGERARDPEIDCLIQIQLAFIYLYIYSLFHLNLSAYTLRVKSSQRQSGDPFCAALLGFDIGHEAQFCSEYKKARVSFSPVMTHAHSFVCSWLGLDQKWSPHAIQISKHLSLENGTSWTCEKHVLVRVFCFNIKIKNIDFINLKRWWESYSIIYVHQNL